MFLSPVAALCVLSAPGPGVEPPAPPKPAPGVVNGQLNRGGHAPAPLSAVIRKQLAEALLRSSQKLRDFVGPQPHNPFLYVPWERKVGALLELSQGNDTQYKFILQEIRQKRDYALDDFTSSAKTARTMEREFNRFPVTDPDTARRLRATMLTARRQEALWRMIHDGKLRELAVWEALGRAVIGVREAERRAAPR